MRVAMRGVVLATVLAAALAAPCVAGAQGCPEANPTYFDACGPTFEQPGWGDAGGWTDPSKYSTIQLADINGDGKDELIARNDEGLEIWWFDTSVGQWRPQVDANGVQQVLRDFASPAPGTTPATDWTKPEYYSTIQAANIDGQPGEEILARFSDGMHVYKYFPPAGTNDIDGGTWKRIGTGGPFSDADGYTDPSLYQTIKAGDFDNEGGGKAELVARTPVGVAAYRWDGSGWSAAPMLGDFTDGDCTAPACYLDFRAADLTGGGTDALIGRDASGVSAWSEASPGNAWRRFAATNEQGADTVFSDQSGSSDCPFGGSGDGSGDCLGSSPAYYETLQAANVDGTPGDELLARASDGLRVKQSINRWVTYDDANPALQYEGSWSRHTGVTDAIDQTESVSGPGLNVVSLQFTGTAVQVIGPTGPNLGTAEINLDGSATSFDQSAGSRQAQQVMFSASGLTDGPHTIVIAGANVDIDAINVWAGPGPPTTGNAIWTPLPTLGALAGSPSELSSTPGEWGSIRTGDILGNGRDQVLALDQNGLEAWSYDPASRTWAKLPGSLPLTGDWLTNPAYYSTIQVGDITGDGRDAVIARGPYGIRTWFYDRRGTGGWERYLPYGYAPFPTAGQQAAFGALNALALSKGAITSGEIRDVWTTAGNAPDTGALATTLATLQNNLAGSLVGNCSNQTNLAPPTYASCTPPANSSGFTANDWTAVVNELLSEAYSAEQVAEQYTDLKTIRQSVFESESGALPAIGSDLQLPGAAGNTATFNLESFFSVATGIAGSIAGLADPLAGAGLAIASYLFSALPSASPTATSTAVQTTYSGLLGKLATAQDEMSDAWSSQLQQVLGDQGLLDLVAQLRERGTWKLDINGMISASREAFALQTYQALLPTMYQRYAVTDCAGVPPTDNYSCTSLPTGPYVISSNPTPPDIMDAPAFENATWLGPISSTACPTLFGGVPHCDYANDPGTIPDGVANIVWGPISDTCNYVPGNPNTVWHYGCSLGVPIASSIGADSPGWTFTTQVATPVIGYAMQPDSDVVRAVSDVARAKAAHLSARASRATSSASGPRDVLGPLRFTGRVLLSRRLRLGQMRVVVDRTLFEHGRREELARATGTRRLAPFALTHLRGGVFTSAARRGRPQVRLQLRPLGNRGVVRVDLRLTGVRIPDIRALCGVLPARVSRASRPLELETRLRLLDGGLTGVITVRRRWSCVRDRKGEFVGIRPVKPRRPTARPGLAVHVSVPRVLTSGRRAVVRVTVLNRRRRRPSRVVSSLWHLRITVADGGTPRTLSLRELRAGRSRQLRLSLRVPRAAGRRVCVQVTAAADSARPAGARRCARIAGSAPLADLGAVQTHPAARERQPPVMLTVDDLARAIERWAINL